MSRMTIDEICTKLTHEMVRKTGHPEDAGIYKLNILRAFVIGTESLNINEDHNYPCDIEIDYVFKVK